MALVFRRGISQLGRNFNNQVRLGIRSKPPIRKLRAHNGDCLLPQIRSDWNKILPASLGITKRIAIINLKIDAFVLFVAVVLGSPIIFNPELPNDRRKDIVRTLFIGGPLNLLASSLLNTLNSYITLSAIGMGIVAVKRAPRLGIQFLQRYKSIQQINGMNNGCQIAEYTASGPFWKYFAFMFTIGNTPLIIYDCCMNDTSEDDTSIEDNTGVDIVGIDVNDE